MHEVMLRALEADEDEEARPSTMTEFVSLRDILIMRIMIVSMKRTMEFCQFTLGEYSQIDTRTNDNGSMTYVIRIRRHKTAKLDRLYWLHE